MTTLIFGATGGVGSSAARAILAQGRRVHLAGRDAAALDALGRELKAPTSVCDVLDDAQIEAAVAAAAGAEGRLEGLIFAVGSIQLMPLKRASRAAMREAFELNVVSAASAIRAAEAPLKAGEGAVVLFSTIAVGQGFANHTVISAAKGGVEGLVRAAAADLAPKVRVNAIAPSLLETKIAAPLLSNEKMAEAIAGLHPIPRLGRGADAGSLAAFLTSPDATWITGQVFHVDGGRSVLRTKG
jgi:NAD(P)-dependent dehydrogenase (short-subunit alcohol dehydrogenase family)